MLQHFFVQFFITFLIVTCAHANTVKPGKTSPASTAKNQQAPAKKNLLDALTNSVQKQYNGIKSATFDFEQSYKHPFLNISQTSKGSVAYIKASGKMVWSYLEPKDKQKKFYIDGKKLIIYYVSDKNAFVHDCYEEDTLSSSVAFLIGTGQLKQSFTISEMQGESYNKNLTWITLTPKQKDAPVKRIFLGINKSSKVEESIVEDLRDGKNHFKFINFKTNPAIPPKTFVFSPPAGVVVQKMPNVSCPEAKTNKKVPDTKKTIKK